ncbi:MAG: beta-L-arabinofuranosidase domain-containing protein [Acidobacteriota bacterium]
MTKRSPLTRRGFLSATASAGAAVSMGVWSPRAAAAVPGTSGAATDPDLVSGIVRPFPLEQVRLGPGPFREARERNSRYLLSLPQDRLLHTFRVNAGLPSSAEPLGGWEKPDCELRGHFTGGHYLSACALTYAATGEEAFKARAGAMVEELAKCQKAHGNGYLSAFPEELFDRLRNGVKVWAPFYTLHKILAGHLDVYLSCGNGQALATAEDLAGWVRNWCKGLSDAHMERILLTEFGGMNAVLYDLSQVTGKEEYRDLAHRFDHRAFFEPLAARRDELTGLHANTQFPKVIGAARRYELTGESRYRDIAEYFWREVTGLRTYATGGTSDGERWLTPPGVLSTALSSSSAECCCAYNMLKLTRHVFAWTGDPRAADYFERTYWNHRLGTQNPEDGTLMYYYPLASGYWKFYGEPLSAFWCCTGTGAEEFARAGDSIYFHDDAGIFVNLFIASEVRWPEKGLRLRQETSFPDEETTRFIVEAERPVPMTLRLRVPWWATRGGTVKLNGAALPAFASPSSYLTLTRTWRTGDRVELTLPMSLSVAPTPDDPSVEAVMYGPLVLAGRLGAQGLTRAMTYGGYDCELKGEPVPVADIAADPKDASSWVEAVPGRRLGFRTKGQARNLELIPLNRLEGERYAVYWKVRQPAG